MALGREQVATKIAMHCDVVSWLHWQQRNLIGPFKSDRRLVQSPFDFILKGPYLAYLAGIKCEKIPSKKNTLARGLAGLKANTQTSRWDVC